MISRLRHLTLLAVAPAAIAAGCGGSGGGKTAAQTTNTPTAPATHFHAGQPCKASQSLEYSAKGFTCVHGKLQRKSSQAPATKTNKKAHTTTSAPQGY